MQRHIFTPKSSYLNAKTMLQLQKVKMKKFLYVYLFSANTLQMFKF